MFDFDDIVFIILSLVQNLVTNNLNMAADNSINASVMIIYRVYCHIIYIHLHLNRK